MFPNRKSSRTSLSYGHRLDMAIKKKLPGLMVKSSPFKCDLGIIYWPQHAITTVLKVIIIGLVIVQRIGQITPFRCICTHKWKNRWLYHSLSIIIASTCWATAVVLKKIRPWLSISVISKLWLTGHGRGVWPSGNLYNLFFLPQIWLLVLFVLYVYSEFIYLLCSLLSMHNLYIDLYALC